MGRTASKAGGSSVTVASLNTSWILTSPFEYFEKQGDFEQLTLSNIFKAIVDMDQQNFSTDQKFSWGMGSIDTAWKNRFSPFNIIDVGVKYYSQLMNEQEFKQRWDEIYQATKSTVKKYIQEKYGKPKQINSDSQKEIQIKSAYEISQTKKFDLYCYKALLLYYFENKFKKAIRDDIQEKNINNWAGRFTKRDIQEIIDNIIEAKQDSQDQQKQRKRRKQNAEKYLIEQRKSFDKVYLVEQMKLQMTLKCIQRWDYDIIFLQQVSITFLNGIRTVQKYDLISKPPSNSIIMINKSIYTQKYNFPAQNKKFINDFLPFFIEDQEKRALQKKQNMIKTEQNKGVQTRLEETEWRQILLSRLNLNNSSIFQYFQNFILFNVHLNSKQNQRDKQLPQFFNLYKSMSRFIQEKTKYKDCKIIAGGDINNELDAALINSHFQQKELAKLHYFPNWKDSGTKLSKGTVRKQRTFMQPQRGKANILDSGIKDFFFSNCSISSSKIAILNGQQIWAKPDDKSLLPMNDHPYDHFMICAELRKGQF